MALFELFGWLKYFREQREREHLSQRELLKQELKLIGLAILVIGVLVGVVVLAIFLHER